MSGTNGFCEVLWVFLFIFLNSDLGCFFKGFLFDTHVE